VPLGDAVRRHEYDDFDDFYAANFASLNLLIYSQLGSRQEAQDIAQEAFCRAWARWQKIGKYDDPAAWVRRVAWNLARSHWRRSRVAIGFLRKHREVHTPGPGPESVAITRALATLPARQRTAIVLHYIADLSIAEIARQEGVAEGTVKSWLHRGRAALADVLGDRDADSFEGVRNV
jgi:RNA polymerase sigma-70 factor (ECF subfamily)